jgi:quinol-cytochrome oxidoreductase complex cytochrome b subunit
MNKDRNEAGITGEESGLRLLLKALREWSGRLVIPRHRHSIWYWFGWLTLFLLILMLASGLLLTIYYEPSAAPAVADDGRPMATALLTKDAVWNDHQYHRGDIIPLPYEYGREIVIPAPLSGAVQVVKDPSTGSPVKPSAAWVSVEQRIMREAEFGWLIRSIHRYSANLLIAALFIHAFSAMLMRAYRRPRELMWVSGFVLMILLLGFGFTGYLLPWNRLSYAATRVAVSYPEESLPLVGSTLGELVRGGSDVTGGTLTRMFALHVAVLPLATLLVMALHLLLLGTFGVSLPESVKRRGGPIVATTLGAASLALLVIYPILAGELDPASPYAVLPLTVLPVVVAYLLSGMVKSAECGVRSAERGSGEPANRPTGEEESRERELRTTDSSNRKSGIENPTSNLFYRNLLCWTLVLGVVLTLALVAPWSVSGEAGMPVDLTGTLVTPTGVHPEWYLMFIYQLLTVAPGGIAMVILIGAPLLWLLLPFLDRNGRKGRSLVTAFALVLIAAFVGLTVWGYATVRHELEETGVAARQK